MDRTKRLPGADGAVRSEDVMNYVIARFDGVVALKTWGEMALFYNPGDALKRGTYFCTLKEKDGENDRASQLDRPGVYRLNFPLPTAAYVEHFGPKSPRPGKGGIIDGPWDFTELDRITPHPVYGWMGWASVLNPSGQTFEVCKRLLVLAHEKAVSDFRKRLKR